MPVRGITIFILSVSVFGSALGLVVTRQESRVLGTQLYSLQSEKRLLKQEWSQLLFQQSTLASRSRVEELARHSIGMITPLTTTVVHTK